MTSKQRAATPARVCGPRTQNKRSDLSENRLRSQPSPSPFMAGTDSARQIPIEGAYAYFDTVGMWITRRLERWERDTLEGLCGKVIHCALWKTNKPWIYRMGFRVRLVLQQPTIDALLFLQQRFQNDPPPLINQVACDVDILTDTEGHAASLQAYIDERWRKRWHRPSHGVELFAGETSYVGWDNRKSQHVIYSGKPSRHCGTPCCHIEHRFLSHRILAALGIESISDLIKFDHRAFWKKRLLLVEYELEDLGKRWAGRHLNHASRCSRVPLPNGTEFVYNKDVRIGGMLCQYVREPGYRAPILMALVDLFSSHGRSLAHVLKPIDISPLIGAISSIRPHCLPALAFVHPGQQ